MPASTFAAEVKKALIDRNMTVSELACKMELSRQYTSAIINGKHINEDIKRKIGTYLGVSAV